MQYLIFDFDGVIGDTYEAAVNAHVEMGSEPTIEAARVEMERYFTTKPHHTRSHTLTKEEMLAEYDWVSRFGAIMHKNGIPLFKTFVDEICKIETKYKAVVSSGSQQYVLPALAKTNINPSHTLAFENHHSKEEKIEAVCRDWGVKVEEVYYITDTLADVFELRDMIQPGKLIAVSWGFCSYQQLATELDERYILKNPSDIHKVLTYA